MRLETLTFLVNYPTITRLYLKFRKRNHGSSCDTDALINLPGDWEIQPTYVQIWEEPSVCVAQLTYVGRGHHKNSIVVDSWALFIIWWVATWHCSFASLSWHRHTDPGYKWYHIQDGSTCMYPMIQCFIQQEAVMIFHLWKSFQYI